MCDHFTAKARRARGNQNQSNCFISHEDTNKNFSNLEFPAVRQMLFKHGTRNVFFAIRTGLTARDRMYDTQPNS